VFSYYVHRQCGTTRIRSPHAALLSALQQSIDISCWLGHSSKLCCCGPWREKQTDGCPADVQTHLRILCGLCKQQSLFPDVYANTHTHLMALCTGLPKWAGTTKVKPIWILLKQQTVSGSGISWAICKSALRSRQIIMPAPTAQFFTGRMPFLSPNEQCQSTEGIHKYIDSNKAIVGWLVWRKICATSAKSHWVYTSFVSRIPGHQVQAWRHP